MNSVAKKRIIVIGVIIGLIVCASMIYHDNKANLKLVLSLIPRITQRQGLLKL
jgi:hypothetical protein